MSDVSAERIERDIETIATFSESDPSVGYSRPTFSDPWRQARDYVIAEAEQAGAEWRVDAAGNVHVRHADVGWDERVWLCGSHVDSVPSGGKYDGVAGVIVALEALRVQPGAPLELIVFAEEEGTTFGRGMAGSRAWVGELGADDLGQITNRHGQTYLEAGAPYGVDPDRLEADRLNPDAYLGMVEMHVEQGLGLWNADVPVASVTRVNGRRHYNVRFAGQANHAGSTKMGDRRDALVGASEAIQAIERIGRALDAEVEHTVMTVGQLDVRPNANNVIPGQVDLVVDVRAQDEATLDRGDEELRTALTEISERRSLDLSIEMPERLAPSPLDTGIRERLQSAAQKIGIDLPEVPSGALHDAAILAPYVPTGMLFVASKDGISHNPAEFSRVEDVARAAEIVGALIAT